jgi:hypothetical protein
MTLTGTLTGAVKLRAGNLINSPFAVHAEAPLVNTSEV